MIEKAEVLTLSNSQRVVVLDSLMYNNWNYVYTDVVSEDETTTNGEFAIYKVDDIDEDNLELIKVVDIDEIMELSELFAPRINVMIEELVKSPEDQN